MVYAQPRTRRGEWAGLTSQGFWDTNGSPYLGQTTRPSDSQPKQRSYRIVDIAVPADDRVRLKENEKRDKYLDLARELKKLWNMKVTVMPMVIGALGTVIKGLVKGLKELEIRRRVETIQTTEL